MLKKTMLSMQTLLRNFPEALVLLDSGLHIQECTSKWLHLVGLEEHEVLGKKLTEVFPPNAKSRVADLLLTLQKAISSGETQASGRLRYDITQGNGSLKEKYWEITVTPFTQDGEVFLLQRVEDVTAHVLETSRLEEKVNESHMTNLIIQNLQDYAVILLDLNGVITSWNPGAEKIKGYKAEEIIGKHLSIFYVADDLALRIPQKALETAMEKGRDELEGWRKRKDGSLFWASVVITKLQDQDGRAVGFVKITRDLTEKKNSENALIRAFEDSTRQRAEFTASMSHEIRNPMNGVVSAARLLQTSDMSQDNLALVNIILDSSESLLSIVNDILDYTKLDVSDFALVYKPFDLRAELQYTVNLARINGRDKTSAVITLDMDPDIPTRVEGDSIRFRQVLTNLLDNAVKFTPQGSITVKAQFSGRVSSGFTEVFQLHVSVTDTGVGIQEDEMVKLFKPFSQTSSSGKTRFKGSGLGLSICRRILEIMGGRIGVESVPGEGSTFKFTVPFRTTEEAPARKDNGMVTESEGDDHLAQLLLVDDSDINRRVVRRLLNRLGYTHVDVAENGLEALDHVRKTPYSLILMDLMMPVMDGFQATARLREEGYTIPIIALTGDALPTTASKCLKAGMDGYLKKPLEFAEVQSVIREHLATSRALQRETQREI